MKEHAPLTEAEDYESRALPHHVRAERFMLLARRFERDRTELIEALKDVLSDITHPEEKWAEGSSIFIARAIIAQLEAVRE